MLTNYDVTIETWARPKHFTYSAFFVDLYINNNDLMILFMLFTAPFFHFLSAGVKGRNSSRPPCSSPERNPWKPIWSMKQNLVVWGWNPTQLCGDYNLEP